MIYICTNISSFVVVDKVVRRDVKKRDIIIIIKSLQ